MKTADLIAALAASAGPARPVPVARPIALACLAGGAVAVAILIAWLGLRPMHEAMRSASFWMKAAYTLALSVAGVVAVVGPASGPPRRAPRGRARDHRRRRGRHGRPHGLRAPARLAPRTGRPLVWAKLEGLLAPHRGPGRAGLPGSDRGAPASGSHAPGPGWGSGRTVSRRGGRHRVRPLLHRDRRGLRGHLVQPRHRRLRGAWAPCWARACCAGDLAFAPPAHFGNPGDHRFDDLPGVGVGVDQFEMTSPRNRELLDDIVGGGGLGGVVVPENRRHDLIELAGNDRLRRADREQIHRRSVQIHL